MLQRKSVTIGYNGCLFKNESSEKNDTPYFYCFKHYRYWQCDEMWPAFSILSAVCSMEQLEMRLYNIEISIKILILYWKVGCVPVIHWILCSNKAFYNLLVLIYVTTTRRKWLLSLTWNKLRAKFQEEHQSYF